MPASRSSGTSNRKNSGKARRNGEGGKTVSFAAPGNANGRPRVLQYGNPALILAVGMMLIVLALAGMSIRRNRTWRSEEDLLEDIIRQSPNKARAYSDLGLDDLRRGRYGKSVEMQDHAIALDPLNWQYYMNRAYAYSEMGQMDNALADFDRVLALNPGSYQAYHDKGMVYGKMGELGKAIEEFTRAIERGPESALSYGNRGLAYSILGENEKALEDLNKAIALDDDYAEAYGNRGNIYLRVGRKELAAADFKKACDLGDRKACEVLGQIGR